MTKGNKPGNRPAISGEVCQLEAISPQSLRTSSENVEVHEADIDFLFIWCRTGDVGSLDTEDILGHLVRE